MNIEIFKAEINAGIADRIQSNTSIAYSSLVIPRTADEGEAESAKLVALSTQAMSNPDQIDHYYLNSVLVSTGWNKNDDVFDIDQTWAARNTPEDKQFNFMHDENDIIGHITGNCVLNADGKVVADGLMPDKFDIITSAVIYKSWSDPEKRERINKMIAEIEEGKWFVSMECLFNGFDYAVVTPDGDNSVIARDENSAFLTKHLRAYGGEGQYEGYKVGRLLKNISFSGKGLVNNPANPNSVILKETNPFKSTQACVIEETGIREIDDMSNDNALQQQLDTLKAELDASKQREESLEAKLRELDEKAVTEKLEALQSEIQTRDEAIAAMTEAEESLKAEKVELSETLTKAQDELNEMKAQLDEIKAEAHKAQRLAALKNAGLNDEDAADKLEKFAEASDEMFADIVALMAQEEAVEEEEATEAEVEAEETAEADEDVDSDEAADEADAEVLEEVEEEVEASLTDAGETDSVQEARTVASEWLKSNVLKTTRDK